MVLVKPVELVVTEPRSGWNDERRQHYEAIARRLEDIAGAEVRVTPYLVVGRLEGVSAVVLSGSFEPWEAHEPRDLAKLGDAVRAYEGPVFGICAGMQLQVTFAGGSLARVGHLPETGFGPVEVLVDGDLLQGLPPEVSVYKHHTWEIDALPDDFRVLARSGECPVEAISAPDRLWWGTQFHPEEFDREHPAGERVLRNFFELAGSSADGRRPLLPSSP
ncbi:MAG: gamma-glutamyl-gamma-aminobutyrate hydrolase family protein [Actinomycetota bacterium]|nr:gamma-glutamyl-gamma-aminobutyrate hydrolase family protein [Actinomycetota bacterium]